MADTVRSTQRAPRACLQCTKRKVKCDKALPCKPCRMRGITGECKVEPVRVKGLLQCGQNVPEMSYDELLSENLRLRSALSPPGLQCDLRGDGISLVDKHEDRLYRLLKSHSRRSGVNNKAQVLFPSVECSEALLQNGMIWTSWLHCAVDQETFANEVREYFSVGATVNSAVETNASWHALFFSYLTASLLLMPDLERATANLPHENAQFVLDNWYDSAIYFLQESEFLRIVRMTNVQSIAVLGLCFINFGDFNMYYHLWGCAIRMGQSLGLNTLPSASSSQTIGQHKNERLWRSLVINDWLTIPLQANHLSLNSSSANLRFPVDSQTYATALDGSHAYEYHAVLGKLSMALRRFQERLVLTDNQKRAVASAARDADEELATIVLQLPSHLKADDAADEERFERDLAFPWIPWQKQNICVLLLYYRLAINRSILHSEHGDSLAARGARAVCLDSAHGIYANIVLHDNESPTPDRRLVWSFLLPTFAAAATLVTIKSSCSCGTSDNHRAEVRDTISWFQVLADGSHYAALAALVLEEMLGEYS